MGIGSHGRKNDRLDCEVLARALEQGHVARAHVLSDRARELRELAEQHRALTETRKRLIIHARGLARGRGWDVPECEPGQFADKLARQSLPEPYSKLLVPLLAPLQSLEPEIAAVDLRIQECAAAAPGSTLERLASVPGVSVLVASAVLSVLDDATRFHRACEVAAYFGLCPSEHSTGGKQRLGSITKRGNAYARWMLVQSAWCILRSRSVSDPLVRWAQRTAARRGRMRAAVAVARRLVRILWALWRDGTFYDPEQLRWEQARRRADQNNEPPTQADRTAQQQRAQRQAQHKLLRQQRTHQRTLHNHDLEVTHS
jgi:transposase